MSTDRFRYFAAVVETQNLRQASELVGISPPSMSKAISVLEDELGCKLIHPDGRGIGITKRGLEVYGLLTPLLEEHRKFYQRLKEGENALPKIRMASFEVFSSYFMSSFLANQKDYDFSILEMAPGEIEQAILGGRVDIGLTYLPSPDRALEHIEVGSFGMKIFGRKKWEDKEFSEWPFAIPTTELRIHSSDVDSLDMWPKSAPKRKIKYQFELLETALQTSRLGLSVLHCPDFIVRLHNEQVKASLQLEALPTPSGYKSPKASKVYLVGRKGALPSELEGKFAKFMRSLTYHIHQHY